MTSPALVQTQINFDDNQRDESPEETIKRTRTRTKTGCLTCRKRRVKCSEEKPICRNCLKSKRQCDYSTRVVLRKTGDHGTAGFARGYSFPLPLATVPEYFAMPDPYTPLLPRPTRDHCLFPNPANEMFYDRPFNHQILPVSDTDLAIPLYAQIGTSSSSMPTSSAPFHTITDHHPHWLDSVSSSTSNHSSGIASQTENYAHHTFMPPVDYSTHSDRVSIFPANSNVDVTSYPATTLATSMSTHLPSWAATSNTTAQCRDLPTSHRLYFSSATFDSGPPGLGNVLHEAAVENQDDDYFDVLPEEEDNLNLQAIDAARSSLSMRDNGAMLSVYQENSDILGITRHDAFLYPGFLDSYRPEQAANPLSNMATARVFSHFVHSTGPVLSNFERRSRIKGDASSQWPIPGVNRSLWSKTLPTLALRNQGLLHAMLATASLHIAKLQGASKTPSLQHYAWSLKRVHYAVGHNKKRHDVSTLAASLLLGFYEVMTADHMRWSKHLSGAKQLIMEIEFSGMTRQIKNLQATRAMQATIMSAFLPSAPWDSFVDNFPILDDDFIEILIGRNILSQSRSRPSTQKVFLALEDFETIQDLVWCFLKQDVIQASISGNELLWGLNFILD